MIGGVPNERRSDIKTQGRQRQLDLDHAAELGQIEQAQELLAAMNADLPLRP
jgi:hypothetical protein